MCRDRARRLSILMFVPPQPIDKYTSADNSATLAPVVDSVCIALQSLLMSQTVVVFLGRLVSKVLEGIPLTARLRIDVELIVHAGESKRLFEVDLGLFEVLATEAGELHIVEGPVELDVFTILDFL